MDAELIAAFSALTTGIYVLTVREGARRHGMSSSWVTQVSGDPPLLVAAVDTRHFTYAIVERTGRFGLNVIGRRGRHLEEHFYSAAARRADNLAAVASEDSAGGLPMLADAMLSIECRVVDRVPAGDHALFVAAIERVIQRAADVPLTSQDLDYVYVGEVVRRGP